MTVVICFRQFVRDRGHIAGTQPAKRSQLLDPLVGGRRPPGCVSGHAPGGSVRRQQQMVTRPRALRHVD